MKREIKAIYIKEGCALEKEQEEEELPVVVVYLTFLAVGPVRSDPVGRSYVFSILRCLKVVSAHVTRLYLLSPLLASQENRHRLVDRRRQ